MNVDLLRKVQAHILEEPARLRMSQWLERATPGEEIFTDTSWGEPDTAIIPKCGTVACIAGWVSVLGAPENAPEPPGGVEYRASNYLNCHPADAHHLFMVSYWPDDLYDAYVNECDTNEDRAAIACQAIDRFIANRGEFRLKQRDKDDYQGD